MQGFGLQGRDLQGLGQRRLRVYGFAARGISPEGALWKNKGSAGTIYLLSLDLNPNDGLL